MNNIFIIGTRAQLIKVAPVIKTFENNNLPVIFIMTGQHNDTMSDLIQEFGIQTSPLSLIKNKEHASIIALLLWIPHILILLIKSLKKFSNAYVFVHGDTLTTLLSTLAAKLCNHKVVHLESGLTSDHLFNPFPEEIIRRIVFKLTNIACCPNEIDIKNMAKYPKVKLINTQGNSILDSIQYLKIGEEAVKENNSLLISIHRFQNIYSKERLSEISAMLIQLSNQFKIYFVLHPATLKKLKAYDLLSKLEMQKNIELLPRMTYKNFLNLALSTECVITDGGSNQEELAFFGHPTVILRETTERQDGIGENAILLNNPKVVYEKISRGIYLDLRKEKKILSTPPSKIICQYFL